MRVRVTAGSQIKAEGFAWFSKFALFRGTRGAQLIVEKMFSVHSFGYT
jgi:hypothetical protein